MHARTASRPKAQAELLVGEKKKRIFLIEDHTLFREGLKRMITEEPELAICGEAANAREAMDYLERSKPDLVLLDISLPGTDGLELVKSLRAQHSTLLMMVLSMHAEELYAERVLRAGAKGYIMKQVSARELIGAIRTVLKGEIYLSPQLSTKLLRSIVAQKGEARNELQQLSDRELEIFRLLGRGFTTGEIARSLSISVKTVESHRGNIRQKLKLGTGAELLRLAISHSEGRVH
jgi:DNA-binding NarL/FixJ family response regulator